MNLKQYHRYRMNFQCKASYFSTVCVGASLFLLSLYYFLIRELSSITVAEAIFSLTVPMILSIGFIVLMRFVKLDAPGLFAIICTVMLLFLMIGLFSAGSVIRAILGCVWYALCALILIGTAGGYLPGKLPATLMFSAAILARVVFFTIRLRGIGSMVLEGSSLLLLLALASLPRCFQSAKPRT